MDFELTEEQRSLREAARAFAKAELAPYASTWDEDEVFPRDAIQAAGELGLCGLYSPQEWGGLDLSRVTAAMIFEELATADPSTAAYISIHNMATWMVTRWGTAEIKAEWGAALTSGEKLASYCLTEPDAGSDAASIRTAARKEHDCFVLDGTKVFISGAGETDLLVVMARSGGPGSRGISAFAVPARSGGVSFGRKERKMGWNTQPTRAITFDSVAVDGVSLLASEGEGFHLALKGLDGGRVNVAGCSVGAGQAALDAARSYVGRREQFGKKLAEFQALQFKLADMAINLVAARQMVYFAASKLDLADPSASVYAAMAKRFATDVGFGICNDALQLHGGYGYMKDYPLEKLMRDSRVHCIVEGTNEIMRVIVARRLLKTADPLR